MKHILTVDEQAAVAGFAETHGPELRRFLAACVFEPADREDILQEVFARLAAYEDLDRLKNPRAFLFQVVRNILHDRGRRETFRQMRRHQPVEDVELADPAPDQYRVLEAKERLAIIHDALADLPPNVRIAFILHRIDGRKHSEIAEAMGVSAKSVQHYIARALAHFKNVLGAAPRHASSRDEDGSR